MRSKNRVCVHMAYMYSVLVASRARYDMVVLTVALWPYFTYLLTVSNTHILLPYNKLDTFLSRDYFNDHCFFV